MLARTSARREGTGLRGKLAGKQLLALVLFVLGVAGLSLAAATKLNAAWTGNFQAGTAMAETDCQPADQPIVGRMAAPQFVGSGDRPWASQQVEFTGINQACLGQDYEVAYRTDGDWELLESPSGKGTVESGVVTAALGNLDLAEPTEFAIVIYR